MSDKPKKWFLKGAWFDDNGRPGYVGHPEIRVKGPEIPCHETVEVVEYSIYKLALKQVDVLAEGMETAKETVHRLVKERVELLARFEKHSTYATAISKELDNARKILEEFDMIALKQREEREAKLVEALRKIADESEPDADYGDTKIAKKALTEYEAKK